ncbi:MAG: hypothetical protein WAT84_02715 [Candidatus Moraniibacteriota bacterium]
MPETHYIEIDEEIISTVSRLRKSGQQENIFVLPKRALILQSIINLKLLGREAEKLGKSVTIMTQDEQGMRLAEKAGLRVQEYQETALRQHRSEAPARFTVRHGESIPMPEPTIGTSGIKRSSEIGSADFYGEAQTSVVPERPVELSSARTQSVAPLAQPRQTLRVRNASPPVQTALNSLQSAPPLLAARPVARPALSVPQVPPHVVEQNADEQTAIARKEKVRRLFEGRAAGKNPGGNPVDRMPPIVPAPLVARPIAPNGQWKMWGTMIAAIVLLVGAVWAGYFFLRPEAIIAVEPQTATQSVKLSLVGTVGGEKPAVPIRYIEEEKTIRLSREATGQSAGNGVKSSGTISIINSFSEVSQSLVATTRFELPDGRLYRLVSGVTVPGMKTEDGKPVPGKIDARVVADSAGTKYNISSGTFSIPGFKGGPKFEKITAEVKGTFTGGSDGASTAGRTVSEADLEKAKAVAAEEALQAVIDELTNTAGSGKVALKPSFQANPIGTPSSSTARLTTDGTFDYEVRFQVRGFVIDESAVRDIIDRETTESGGVVLRPYRYTVQYGAVLSNFESKRVDVTVESKVLFRAPLEAETVKQGLLGLDETGIRTYLADHPEIKRLQVEFKPKVFIATIPEDPVRVTVDLLEETDNE